MAGERRQMRRRPLEIRVRELAGATTLVGLVVGLMMLLASAMLLASPEGAPTAPESLPSASQEENAAASAATAADCAECHEIVEAFANGPHGRAMRRSDPELFEQSCVGCHGPGEAHIDDPNTENIVRLPADAACATCHQAQPNQLWLATRAHVRHSVACLDCHASGHGEIEEAPLLAAQSYELCGGCHASQASSARQPFAHREGSEPFGCTECHSAHGLERTGRLLAGAESGPCLDCHTELAGPFVFPHPPRSIHGCTDCHQPHGSTNPRLLTRRTQVSLCVECHTNVPAFHDLSQARFRNCVSCHTAVHGSNRDPVLFDP